MIPDNLGAVVEYCSINGTFMHEFMQESSGSVFRVRKNRWSPFFEARKNRTQKAARVARKGHFNVSCARIRAKMKSVWRLANFNKDDAQEFHIKLNQCGGIAYQK